VSICRAAGIRAGLLRPITLWPFPQAEIADLARSVDRLLVVELSLGQMLEDVRLAANGRCPVEFHGRQGGAVPTAEEVVDQVRMLVAARDRVVVPGVVAPEAVHEAAVAAARAAAQVEEARQPAPSPDGGPASAPKEVNGVPAAA
jgi:TPP-dependent indolepyruvate ferredoxin oxidoreductase alpha subunit